MPSKLEAILTALLGALDTGLPFVTVLRGAVLPEELTTSGLVILRDGEPGDPGETFSPHRFHYEHMAEIEIFVPGTETRDAAFDALKTAVGTVIAANRTAGGADWIEAMAPAPADIPVGGADTIKAATIPVVLHYWTADPLS
jgi:hypothetical protein